MKKFVALLLICFLFLGYFALFTPPVKAQPTFVYANSYDGTGTLNITDTTDSTTAVGSSPQELQTNIGNNLLFTATPPGGYQFSYWSDGYQDYFDNPQQITAAFMQTMTAYYTVLPPSPDNFTITATDDAHSTVAPSGAVTVTQGASQSFSWTVDSGYLISQVLVDGAFVSVIPPYVFTNVQANHTIDVQSEIITTPPVPGGEGTYRYTFMGPYYDNGLLDRTDSVAVTLNWVNGLPYTLNLTVSPGGGTTISTAYPIYSATWNASTILNATRLFIFQPTVLTQTIHICVPDTTKPVGLYTFPVTDWVGMSNAFLQTKIILPNGGTYIVEQVDLNNLNNPSFVMQQYLTYTLTFTCDQGDYSRQFTAQNTYTVNLNVLAGSFPTNTTATPTATAVRTAAPTIRVTYYDPNATTTWIWIQVTHVFSGTTITDYTGNVTNNNYTVDITVDNATEYSVRVQAYRNGTIMEWDMACPIYSSTNPFSGMLSFLGDWPSGIDPAQIFAAGIIMAFLGLGSFKSAGVSCLLAWIATGILIVIGWYIMSIPLFAFAGVLSILVVIDEKKTDAREA